MNRLLSTVLTGLFFLSSSGTLMAIEEAKYTLVKKEAAFELRDYEAHILAETIVEGGLEEASNLAFRRLFGYISGDNQSRNKIAMTAPVSQSPAKVKIDMTAPVSQQAAGDKKWAVSFMMPASYTMDTLPKPNDAKVVLRLVPARRVAAVRYSGLWSEVNYKKHHADLEAWIRKNNLSVLGDASWARYNGPMTPWLMRRNEILIPVLVIK